MSSQLYSPIMIGDVQLKNRLMMPAMNLSYATKEGYVTSRLVEFYKARSEGGAGLIVVGAVGVDPNYISPAGVVQLCSDEYIRGMTALTDAIHKGGAKCFAQLWHPGAYARSSEYGKAAIAPSAVKSGFTREVPEEMSLGDVKRIVKYFGQAAERAKRAGFDGVELVGSAGYLISQFLSPKTNQRADIYGGYTATERMRFLREIITAVRRSCTSAFPIMVRLAGNEFVEGGNGLDQCIELAKALDKLNISAISITGGWHETNVPQLTMDVPAGAFVYLARQVKRHVSCPVCACNRLDAKTAEKVIDDGDADIAGIGRGFVADPQLGEKAVTGKYSMIKPCIGCNQGCMDHIFKLEPLSCVTGLDNYSPAHKKAVTPKNILVVGAGPAGLEFARLAALQGHSVTVREKSRQGGGQIRLAAAAPGRSDFNKLADWLTNACIDAGVRLEFGVYVDGDDITHALKSGYDQVIIATGSKPKEAPFPISSEATVFNARQVLSGKVNPGKRVVIIGANATAVETALYLAEAGTMNSEQLKFLMTHQAEDPQLLYELLTKGNRQITLLARHSKIGRDIGASTRWSMLADMKRRGIETSVMDEIVLVDETCVKIRKDGEVFLVPCDCVVLAIGSESSLPQFDEDAFTGRIRVIGDAENVANLSSAIASAHEAASEI